MPCSHEKVSGVEFDDSAPRLCFPVAARGGRFLHTFLPPPRRGLPEILFYTLRRRKEHEKAIVCNGFGPVFAAGAAAGRGMGSGKTRNIVNMW